MHDSDYSVNSSMVHDNGSGSSTLSASLKKNQDSSDSSCPISCGHTSVFFFKIQHIQSPFLSEISLMWFLPCHDAVMVCSQAAVLWWQASLSMKSFLLTSRCTFVGERLAPQIMEGLTAQLDGHLEIKDQIWAAVWEHDWNVNCLWTVHWWLYVC